MNNRTGNNKGNQLGCQISFWGINWLETMAMAIGMGVVMYLFMCFGSGTTYGGGSVWEMIAILPYYILTAGTFAVFIVGVAYFQTYFSVLVSMNATRRTAVISILTSIITMLFGVIAVAALIWKLVPNDVSEAGISLIPLFVGIMFLAAAMCVILGTVIVRWGKAGIIAFTILCMLIGGCVGAGFVIIDSEKIAKLIEILVGLNGFDFRIVTVAGIVIYLLAGIFSAAATRKMEVRV